MFLKAQVHMRRKQRLVLIVILALAILLVNAAMHASEGEHHHMEKYISRDYKYNKISKSDWKRKQTISENHLQIVYSFSNDSWQLSNICRSLKSLEGNPDFFLTKFHSVAGSVNLYVHNPKKDAISGTIMEQSSFESANVDTIVTLLRKDPDLSLIDIGTNVGLHTMAAALLGRHVVAIDAGRENIQHVWASVKYNNFGNRVTLIHNALSDTHGTVKFSYGTGGDFGLGHVNADNIESKMKTKFRNYFQNGHNREISAVKLDDFLTLPCFQFIRKILIKIDVEGHEHRVLLGAEKFMQQNLEHVKGIMMEWQWFGGREAEHVIQRLMRGWNFEPYKFLGKLELLHTKNTGAWPNDVLWLPKDSK